jgi:hypothetical protein
MALNVASLFETDWSISTTGYVHRSVILPIKYLLISHFHIKERSSLPKTGTAPQNPGSECPAILYRVHLGCFKSELNRLLILK